MYNSRPNTVWIINFKNQAGYVNHHLVVTQNSPGSGFNQNYYNNQSQKGKKKGNERGNISQMSSQSSSTFLPLISDIKSYAAHYQLLEDEMLSCSSITLYLCDILVTATSSFCILLEHFWKSFKKNSTLCFIKYLLGCSGSHPYFKLLVWFIWKW